MGYHNTCLSRTRRGDKRAALGHDFIGAAWCYFHRVTANQNGSPLIGQLEEGSPRSLKQVRHAEWLPG